MENIEQKEKSTAEMLKPRDISADYDRIMAREYGWAEWHDFLQTLKGERFLLLRIDLSQEKDRSAFVQKANFMKAFRQGGISEKHPKDYPGQRRVAIVRCTSKQYSWAANAFCSDVKWEEVVE